MESKIKKDCFAYREQTDVLPERCMALNDLECKKHSQCNFYCHTSKFNFDKMLNDIKNYASTHNANGTKKYKVTRKEILETI